MFSQDLLWWLNCHVLDLMAQWSSSHQQGWSTDHATRPAATLLWISVQLSTNNKVKLSSSAAVIMPPDQQQPSSESVSTNSKVKLSSSASMPPDHQQGSSGFVSTDLVIDFVAGGLGAAASVIVGQPLDTVKVGCCNASQDMMTEHWGLC